jgi:hypothetical protein
MTACGVHGNTLTAAENYGGLFQGAPRLIKVIVGSSIAIRMYTRHPLDLLAQKRRCFSSFISWRWAKIYAPNFAAYQGERVYLAGGTCTFQDGAVTGVGMYAYHKMGAGNGVWSRFSGVKPPLAVEAVNVSAALCFAKHQTLLGYPPFFTMKSTVYLVPSPKKTKTYVACSMQDIDAVRWRVSVWCDAGSWRPKNCPPFALWPWRGLATHQTQS